ncbi:aryl-sulfate sulfotransferase [Breznakia pachnodae]|uniref:Arylsulfotransferase N-terminal domain-containing protein n=1 Tax=Breznakia pachnodae TaxID=265178 RepID=A0ABU0DXR1_9FIRM|nr:aryl-sulfate sulfotransferase [Breznakia pachnodae]MDQ0359366.1 hypothetical protein [Breznakia pachnodae]
MRKKYKIVVGCILVIVVAVGCFVVGSRSLSAKEGSLDWYRENIDLVESESMGDDIYEVEIPEEGDIYSDNYQQVIDEKLEELSEKIEEPVLVYNPYGSGNSSFVLLTSNNEIKSLDYTIQTDGYSDYSESAKKYELSNGNSVFQIIGSVLGEKNVITAELSDGKNDQTYTFDVTMPECSDTIETQLETTDGTSSEELSSGLFALLGHDKSFNSNIYLYDNNGTLRNELPLNGYRSDRILFIDNTMLYSYKADGFVQVNGLGKMVKFYEIDGYEQHHDFIYDEDNNQLLILANENDADTIEDIVVALDLDTGEVRELLDMKDFFPELYDLAVAPEDGNTYGGDELDWIHLNSLEIIGDDLLLSSREVSTIIKIDNYNTDPELDYLIADETLYEGTEYTSLLLDKVGDFVSQAGQHSLVYEGSNEDGTYYVSMYNNNYTAARTRPDLDWSNFEGAGTYQEGEASYYYQYLVDEENNTYTLTKKVALPYSSIVSSIENYEDHLVTSSGMSNCFNEYDSEGNLIREYTYTSEKYAYRAFKYDFSNFYFE